MEAKLATLLATLKDTIVAIEQLVENPAISTVEPAHPAVPAGAVFMPMTKHVLPLPKEEQLSFWGYMLAAWKEAGGQLGQQGPYAANLAFSRQAAAEGRSPTELGRDSWPEALDRYYNPQAYGAAPTPKVVSIADEYPSRAALMSAVNGYSYAVTLDGVEVHMGFGPADRFYTQADGSVNKSQPTTGQPSSGGSTETI